VPDATPGVIELSAMCLQQPESVMEYPFGPEARVFKVHAKMFAIVPESANVASISLKCDPDIAALLRQTYPAVTGGYHLNKKHWNTVVSNGTVADDDLRAWIEDSYDLVVASLPKLIRLRLQGEVNVIDEPT
jgi:predicted DNA-binding protein (MmcQ/YjbR family)